MALFRALETRRRGGLFEDPYAERFLPGSLTGGGARQRASRRSARRICRYIDGRWPGARTSAVGGTRAIDDLLSDAGRSTAGGLPWSRLRHPRPAYEGAGARPPSTSSTRRPCWRRSERRWVRTEHGRSRSTSPAMPFSRRSSGAGLDTAEPAAFVWEGVTNYLTAEAVDGTLREVAQAGGRQHASSSPTYTSGVIDGTVQLRGRPAPCARPSPAWASPGPSASTRPRSPVTWASAACASYRTRAPTTTAAACWATRRATCAGTASTGWLWRRSGATGPPA